MRAAPGARVILVVLLLVLGTWASVGVGVAHAELPYECKGCTWENLAGGGKKLFDESGDLIQEWTPAEWAADRSALEGAAVEIGNINTTTGLEGGRINYALAKEIGDSGYLDGQEVIQKARSSGTELEPDVAEGLSLAGEEGGEIPVGVGAAALGVVALGGAGFVLGVFIGKELGLAQLFGFPEFSLSGTEEKIHEDEGGPACSLTKHEAPWKTEPAYGGGPTFSMQAGTYLECTKSAPAAAMYQTWTYSKTYPEEKHGYYGSTYGAHEDQVKDAEYTVGEIVVRGYANYAWYSAECAALPEPILAAKEQCIPEGIPNVVTPGVAKEVEEKDAAHKIVAPVVPGTKQPTKAPVLPEIDIKKIIEIKRTREYIHEHSPHKKEAEEEAEEAQLLPAPEPDETAEEYNTRIKSDGFTNTEVRVRPEIDINPDVGPDGVAGVAPDPGSKYKPDTHVDVEANPSDAPEPESKGSAPAGPDVPGVELPSVPTPCDVFPFGAPCWLLNQLTPLATTAAAPHFSLKTPFHGTLGVNLAPYEGIMEIVRPVLIFVSFIALVWLMVGAAKSGGGGTDGSDDS